MKKTDYGTYELRSNEKILFYTAGYLCIASAAYLFYRSVVFSCLAGLLVIKLRKGYVSKKAEKRRKLLLVQFKDLLYSLSSSIATGCTMSDGLMNAWDDLESLYGREEPIMQELAVIRSGILNREADSGLLRDLARRSRSEDIAGFVDVYLSVRTGGGDTESIIVKTCDELMDRLAIEREIEKTVSQKRLEANIIACVPVVILAAMNLFSPEYIEPMYTTLAGRIIMSAALGSMLFAYRMIDKITEIEI